jgi:hypothetical protein
MIEHPVILAYIGPETVLPIASVIGAIVGVVLMIWQRVVSFVSGTYARLSGKLPSAQWPSKER